MSAGLKRNINNNVVDTAADRKWSPEVHTKIFIPPIGVTEPRPKFTKAEIGATTTQQEPRRKYVTTAVCSSGSDSSDGGCAGGGGAVGRGRRHPVSRSGSCRGQPQTLSPMSAGALSPSLRSLGVPGSPSAAAMAIGSANHNPTMCASAHNQHRDASPLRSWSDAVSVRSLASIGMGSTDGRKLTIAKMPTSPAELLNLASPQT
ncbi:unnamed protein product [Macrosiphum euphorbiae]|uniref:Uncharacterized protein n=1 Tax=Macrosiphum euphorbiae TaxID=13131 RepID=A0AAV0XBL5_9HEMI|nr:unnamed protein product [Macrosiphum euphorbiae]